MESKMIQGLQNKNSELEATTKNFKLAFWSFGILLLFLFIDFLIQPESQQQLDYLSGKFLGYLAFAVAIFVIYLVSSKEVLISTLVTKISRYTLPLLTILLFVLTGSFSFGGLFGFLPFLLLTWWWIWASWQNRVLEFHAVPFRKNPLLWLLLTNSILLVVSFAETNFSLRMLQLFLFLSFGIINLYFVGLWRSKFKPIRKDYLFLFFILFLEYSIRIGTWVYDFLTSIKFGPG